MPLGLVTKLSENYFASEPVISQPRAGQLAEGGNWKSNPIYCSTLPSTLKLNLLDEGIGMAGATHQIQIRHILVEKKEVADLLLETIGSIPTETGRVQMLMKLASKYSTCPSSKEDGGNLGWLEVGWNKSDPRQPRGGFKTLSNDELNDFIFDGVEKMTLLKGRVFGPFESYEGFHVGLICQEVKLDRIL